MGLDLNTKETYQQFDQHNMCVIKGDERSWRDSVGRNYLCWLAYDRDPKLARALGNCVSFWDGHWVLHRHPGVVPEDGSPTNISRDHWSYFLQFKRLTSSDAAYKAFISRVPHMFGVYSWMWALAGDKFHTWWYYNIEILGARLGVLWNNIIRAIAFIPMGPEHSQHDWDRIGTSVQKNLSKWTKFWRKLLLPHYALHNKAWQVRLLPDHGRKAKLQRLLRKRLGEPSTNLLVLMLLGVTPAEGYIYAYRHMTGYRWGVRLDETNDRHCVIISDPALIAANAYEVDLLRWLYEETKISR